MGVDFDRRLEELGATRMYQRVDCDVDFEATAEAWMDAVLSELASRVETKSQSAGLTLPSLTASNSSVYSRKNPFPAVLLENIVLNGRGSIKETHHVEFSLEGSGLTYEPGDMPLVFTRPMPRMWSMIFCRLFILKTRSRSISMVSTTCRANSK
jgi:sulfite reductase (NADPH) flavoprotein alpha-component